MAGGAVGHLAGALVSTDFFDISCCQKSSNCSALINENQRGTNVKRMKDQHVAGNRTASGVLELVHLEKCEEKGRN